MTTLLRKLITLRFLSLNPGSSRWWSQGQSLHGPQRGEALLVAGGGRSGPGYALRLDCRQHTEAGAGVEVDLKRLDGEDDGIVEVLMCRQNARNALGHVFVSQMRELVSSLCSDTAARAVIFRSMVPGVFCAGADLKERALMNNTESDLFVHGLRSLMTHIAVLPMPTIAAVDGVALGGGLELALACDLRTAGQDSWATQNSSTPNLIIHIFMDLALCPGLAVLLKEEVAFPNVFHTVFHRAAGQGKAVAPKEQGKRLASSSTCKTTSSAHVGLIETTRGLLPGAGGSQRLPRMIGVTLAKELIFTGRRIDGQTALEMGLVNRAVEQNEAGDAAYREALSLAREILPQAPIAVRMAKEAMNRGVEVDITSAMAIERMCYSRVIPTRDRQEGMAAFIEKRPPRYIGE